MPTTALNLIADQQKALDAVNSGRNVFFIGGAGTGKSYLLRVIVYSLMSAGKNVVVCAPTGIAAANVGGMTIHMTFNFNSSALIQPKRKKPIQRVTSPVKGHPEVHRRSNKAFVKPRPTVMRRGPLFKRYYRLYGCFSCCPYISLENRSKCVL